MDKSNPKTVVISTLNHFEKESFPISIFEAKLLILAIKQVNVAMIDANCYHVCY